MQADAQAQQTPKKDYLEKPQFISLAGGGDLEASLGGNSEFQVNDDRSMGSNAFNVNDRSGASQFQIGNGTGGSEGFGVNETRGSEGFEVNDRSGASQF